MVVRDVRDLSTDWDDGVELGARIGDHHGKFAPQHRTARVIVETAQVTPIEEHSAAFDPAGRRHETHYGAGKRSFSGPGFADETDEFALIDTQVDAFEGVNRLCAIGRKGDPQFRNLENRLR